MIQIWTDGASSGPKERGGWAAILVQDGFALAISGYDSSSTSNRMELTAVIEGLRAVGSVRSEVTIYTDSAYVKNPHSKGWILRWQQNGWKGHKGDPVANRDLWEQMLELISLHVVKWKKVRGHGNSELNNLADKMAVEAKLRGSGVTEYLTLPRQCD